MVAVTYSSLSLSLSPCVLYHHHVYVHVLFNRFSCFNFFFFQMFGFEFLLMMLLRSLLLITFNVDSDKGIHFNCNIDKIFVTEILVGKKHNRNVKIMHTLAKQYEHLKINVAFFLLHQISVVSIQRLEIVFIVSFFANTSSIRQKLSNLLKMWHKRKKNYIDWKINIGNIYA